MDLRGLMVGRPPLVIFVICLACFALTLMSFALYVKNSELTDPDVSTDWNDFLMNFSKMGFCVLNDEHNDMNTTTVAMPSKHILSTPEPATEELKNFSVSMLLSVIPTVDFAHSPYNITYVTGTISGEQLGLTGDAAGEPINVTMQFSDLTPSCDKNNRCDVIKIYSCVHFQASERVFPNSHSSPRVCELKNDTVFSGGAGMSEMHARMRGVNVHANEAYQPEDCRNMPSIRVHYKLDPTLTVYLSLTDRSVMNLHLMHTSYFLFVMVVTLLIYAAIKGNKQYKQLDKAELLHHTDT